MKAIKEFVFISTLVIGAIFWVQTSIKDASTEAEASMKVYVDQKHDAVEKELKDQREILNRIDDRVYKIWTSH